MSCQNTHRLVTRILGSQTTRQWIDLSNGQEETDPAVLAELEASLLPENVDCEDYQVDCVESQEWTYGLDNTGTLFSEDNTIEITLSDGSVFQFNQPPTGGWSPQMSLWGAEIQAAADAAGLAWFVDTRYRNPNAPTSLVGGGGFAGPPSVPVSEALTNMLWRYVNIQICPSQPVPVSAVIIDSSNPARIGTDLTTDGAVLGPLQRFFVCRSCGDEPVWYLEDGVTLAQAGQIPNCYEPCGTLALVAAPPDRECKFEIDVACDNNNSTDTVDFTNTITRRAKICNGEQIAVDYFQADPDDGSALIPYDLNGDFVDCATGEPVELPDPLLDCVTPANLVCKKKRTYSIFYDNGITPSSSSNSCGTRPNLVRFNQGFTSLGWETGVGLVGVGDDIGPYTGWTPQLTGWFTFGDTHDPYSSVHAFNSQPAPTWRSWTIDGCSPDAQYGAWNLQRDDGCEYKVYPLKKSADIIETIWCLDTVDCDGVPTTKYYEQNEDGKTYTEVDAPENPECYVPCDYVFPNVIMEGAVSPCETKEYTLCDNFNGNQTQFVQLVTTCGAQKIIERYTLQSYNTATSPDDLVEYNVQGEIVVCGTNDPFVEPVPECDDFELITLYKIEPSSLSGFRNREWHGTDDTIALSIGTDGTPQGRTFRENHDFSLTPDVDNIVNSFVLNDTDNTAAELDVQVMEGYIVVTEPVMAQYAGGSEGYWAVELGHCCGPLELIAESGGFSPDRVMPFEIPAGIHKARLWNIDSAGSNSSANLQVSIDGGVTYATDNTPDVITISRDKPVEECVIVKICKPTEDAFDFLTGESINLDDMYACPINCSSNSGGSLESAELCDGSNGIKVEVVCCSKLTPTRWGRTYNSDNNVLSSENIWEISGYDNLLTEFGCPPPTNEERIVYFQGSVYVDGVGYNFATSGIHIPSSDDDLKASLITAMNQAVSGTGVSFRSVGGAIEMRGPDCDMAYSVTKGLLDDNRDICWDKTYFIYRDDLEGTVQGDSISSPVSNPYDPLSISQLQSGSTGVV